MDGTEDRIRELAYLLWEEEGRHAGRDLEYWKRAQGLIATGQGAKPKKAGSPAGRNASGGGKTAGATSKRTRAATVKGAKPPASRSA